MSDKKTGGKKSKTLMDILVVLKDGTELKFKDISYVSHYADVISYTIDGGSGAHHVNVSQLAYSTVKHKQVLNAN